ncbi:phosphatase and actin regulator 4 [Sarotherodon galilaeus]
MSIKRKVFKTEHFQKQEKKYSEHCCVPLCSASAKFNGILSFHGFPTHSDLRRQWLVNIRRDHFTITSHTRVCSRHFASDQLIEPTTLDGRRQLIKGAVPTPFEWNGYKVEPPRRSVWERTERHPELVPPDDQEEHSLTRDHDYCSVPEPPFTIYHLSAAEDLSKDVETLRKEIQELRVQREFGLQRFAGSDTDIRFYTSMVCITITKHLAKKSIILLVHSLRSNIFPFVFTFQRQLLQPIDEFFLFLVFLSAGLKERDLAHRFNIHQSTVSRIIATWTNFLATALGSQCIWLTREEVQAYLPEEFKDFSDTQMILDCTELRCQTPSSPSEMYSSYKSHCTMKALVGIAPHGPVTFISNLYAGSVSDKELFKQSGIAEKLTEDMAVMVDKGFLITDCCKCKVYCPPFLSKQKQMPAYQVKETQAIARLRVHVERVIRRIKQNKLFDTIITMSHVYNINQLFAVACMLSNYQNTALVKKWVK